MGHKKIKSISSIASPFNSPVETGLRAIVILMDAYPISYSLERLVIFDYLSIHSDDIVGGPAGLHPKTPHRSGELVARRKVLEDGLQLYMAYGLVEKIFDERGISYAATEQTGPFLDLLAVNYIIQLREKSRWVFDSFHSKSDSEMDAMVQKNMTLWGGEFKRESVLWMEGQE